MTRLEILLAIIGSLGGVAAILTAIFSNKNKRTEIMLAGFDKLLEKYKNEADESSRKLDQVLRSLEDMRQKLEEMKLVEVTYQARITALIKENRNLTEQLIFINKSRNNDTGTVQG